MTKKLDDIIFTGTHVDTQKYEEVTSYLNELTYGELTTANNEVVLKVMDGRKEIAVLMMRRELLLEALNELH